MMKFKAAVLATALLSGVPTFAAELLTNGGFEAGNLSGWSRTGPHSGGCNSNYTVGTTGSTSGCTGFGPYNSFTNPTEGSYAAYNSLDGSAGSTYAISQTVLLPNAIGDATISWSDAAGGGAGWNWAQPRTFSVDLFNGAALIGNVYNATFTNNGGAGFFQNWTVRSIDVMSLLSGFGGQSVTLRFSNFIPQTSTGPASFAIDNVSFDATAVPEPAMLGLFGLGVAGLAGLRRRKRA
ncbi:PEP-CTERM sorting domain-containing protein [Sphingoaurantiacus capsulatus]|uniref:PEP-CTERM sorting domain-containing protein n=1 Tax=Sphingoaurantiacus capsulatus TaxID=1771310 RepID=A0ABV7XBH8_9SPHN